jgi:nitrogen permease regulator 3
MFHEVVRWMLQRNLLVSLHLRVRIVVPASLKALVRHRREELRENRWHTGVRDAFRTRRHRARTDSRGSEGDFGLFDELPWYTRRDQGSQHNGAGIREVIEPPILEEGIELDEEIDGEEDEEEEEEESAEEAEAASRRDEDEEGEEEDDNETSILADPGRATAVQRRWLQAMSEGKDELVTRRFDQFVTRHF